MSEAHNLIPLDAVERIDGLIPIFNTIHDILERTNLGPDSAEIRLPQIVVIGIQSSGKSSVLENLVGQPFLPRGSGIVTRCPIVLRMILTPGKETWCEFLHKPNEKFKDFKKVEREIISRTDEIAGTDFEISSESIKITIYSPNVLNLTVVDLPGLVKIPVGQQPEDIEEQVKNLVLHYISSEDAVILAVCPGNVDIANNESIKIAKTVDPNQERTIVVLTKLDLADDYNKMADVLNGKIVPMKLGYVGVINRSQDDIQGNKPIDEVLQYEKKFLAEKFGAISEKHGIASLARKLSRILLQRILTSCSGLSLRLRELLTAADSELKDLGVDEDMTDSEKKGVLFSIVDKFAKEYQGQIDGMRRSEIKTDSLTSGATIDIIIQQRLPSELETLDLFANMSDTQMLVAIRSSMPVGARYINPEVTLNHFIKEEIKMLTSVAIQTVQLLHQEMVNMIQNCLEANKRFPKVNAAIYTVVSDLLSSRMKVTTEILETYIEIQSASAITANPNYSKMFKELLVAIPVIDLASLPTPMVPHINGQPGVKISLAGEPIEFTAEQSDMFRELKILANQVYQVVRWQTQDFIIKAILHTLIYKTVDSVAVELNTKLNESDDTAETLIREPDEIHNRRIQLKNNMSEFYDALKLLDELRKAAAA